MKALSEGTPEDLDAIGQAIRQGERPVAAVQAIFDISEKDAEIFARECLQSLKEQSQQTPAVLEEILTKDGALKRLAVLALYAEQEDTQRKAVMDIAKLQQWVDENPSINLSILSGSKQDVDAFLLQHQDRLTAIMPKRESLPE